MTGTLIWIGDTAAEFRGAVEYCLLNVPQIAFRRDLADAIRRPASDVRWIVCGQSNRDWLDPSPLIRRHPDARSMSLLGPLCQGLGASRDFSCCDWHHWDQVLPCWLGVDQPGPAGCRAVAIVAATMSAAEPLMDLVESTGATAVWCRWGGGQRLRNIDAVWWDDSIASAASEPVWRQRVAAFGGRDRSIQHAWIATTPHHDDLRSARQAGVAVTVSKPHRIGALLAMLSVPGVARRPISAQTGWRSSAA